MCIRFEASISLQRLVECGLQYPRLFMFIKIKKTHFKYFSSTSCCKHVFNRPVAKGGWRENTNKLFCFPQKNTVKKAAHKRRPQLVGGGLSSADTFRRRGFFRSGRPYFLVQKNFGFFEIHGVSARTGWEGGRRTKPIGHFSDKGVNFS